MKKVSETTLNRYLDIVEKKYVGSNPILRWWSDLQFKRACKKIQKESPSIGCLWYMADFIKLAERVYFYNNNRKTGFLFSSSSYSAGENGFVINDPDNFLEIVVKLFSDDQMVIVSVKRTNGTNMITEHTFINNQWTGDRQNYDEVLIDNIIGLMNSATISLMQYCYNKKGSFDHIRKELK